MSRCAKAPAQRVHRGQSRQITGRWQLDVGASGPRRRRRSGMVGTDDLRRLLAATSAAHTKTVLVGDAHQLAPVKARGGMFAQLCTDLPWTQRLSEVWRMRDPQERSASLALRDGGPAPVRRAVEWYRSHDRLHTGDPIAMAHDALAAYRADVAAGTRRLVGVRHHRDVPTRSTGVCTTTSIDAERAAVTAGARTPHRRGDLIISRRNDPTIAVFDAADINNQAADPVRNGNRWHVLAVDPDHDRIAARRLDDGARAAFSGDYLREHITTATRSPCTRPRRHRRHHPRRARRHTSRTLLYVAMTRGRESNHAYLYERIAGETEHEHADQQPGVHVMRRGTSHDAAQLIRNIIANHDDRARTAHDIAAETQDREQLPERVQHLLAGRANAVHARRTAYTRWHNDILDERIERQRFIDEHLSRSQDREQGIDYGLSCRSAESGCRLKYGQVRAIYAGSCTLPA